MSKREVVVVWTQDGTVQARAEYDPSVPLCSTLDMSPSSRCRCLECAIRSCGEQLHYDDRLVATGEPGQGWWDERTDD